MKSDKVLHRLTEEVGELTKAVSRGKGDPQSELADVIKQLRRLASVECLSFKAALEETE